MGRPRGAALRIPDDRDRIAVDCECATDEIGYIIWTKLSRLEKA